MHRLLTVCLTSLILMSSSLHAENLTPKRVTELALAGNMTALAEQMNAAQEAYLAGDRSADEIRALIRPLQSTHPRIVRNLKAWVAQTPDNPFARIALAWNLHIRAFQIRGEEPSIRTSNIAMASFYKMINEAIEHAQVAYAKNPELIPASDAIIRLSRIRTMAFDPEHTLRKVMTTRPNWGTLERALDLTSPGWGGTKRDLQPLCKEFAPMLPDDGTDYMLRCIYLGAARFYLPHTADWLHSVAEDAEKDEMLDEARAELIVSRLRENSASPEEITFAKSVILGMSVPSRAHEFASLWDAIAPRSAASDPYLSDEVLKTGYVSAKAQLADDPLNLGLINFLSKAADTSPKAPGASKAEHAASIAEDRLDLAERRVLAAPFSDEFWLDLVWALKGTKNRLDIRRSDEAYHNAIAYSKTPQRMIAFYLSDKMSQIKIWQAFAAVGETPRGVDPQTWTALVEEIAPDEDIFCPYLRAYRLFRLECQAAAEGESNCLKQFGLDAPLENFEVLAYDVAQRPACQLLLDASYRSLRFSPKPVHLTHVTTRFSIAEP